MRFWIITVAAISVLAAALLWMRRDAATGEPSYSHEEHSTAEAILADNIDIPGGGQRNVPTEILGVAEQIVSDDRRERLESLLASANGEIQFFGRVLDQDRSPVSNVRVLCEIETINTSSAGGQSEEEPVKSTLVTAISNPNGHFNVLGFGTSLTLKSVESDGYTFRDPPGSFRYGKYKGKVELRHSDPATPFEVSIWRNLGDNRSLIQHDMLLKFNANCTTLFVNAITGEIGNQKGIADFEVECRVGAKQGRSWPWFFAIRAPTGELAVTKDKYLFHAKGPYVEQFARDFSNFSEAKWASAINESIYAKTREGKITAALELSVRFFPAILSRGGEATVQIKMTVNPRGSDSLQTAGAIFIQKGEELLKLDQALNQ